MTKGIVHEIAQDYKRVKEELGRKPSRPEYQHHGKFSTIQIIEAFGSYKNLINACGEAYTKGKESNTDLKNKAFAHLISEIEIKKSAINPPLISARTLIIGDTHFPYTHPDAVAWLIALNRKYNFDLVLHAGDEIDLHAMSFHEHDPDLLSPGHELEEAIKMLQPLYKEFPRMLLAESNHGSLIHRKAKHHGLPRRAIRSYRETIDAPLRWEWQEKIKFQTSDGQTNLLVHSIGANVKANAQSRGMNIIQGHHHELFRIDFFHNEEKELLIYGAQTGCLIDDLSYAMAYNKTNKFRPIMGSLGIFNGVPMLLKMLLDKHGRWTGEL